MKYRGETTRANIRGSAPGVALSFNYQPGSQPSTQDVPTDVGFHHPSKYGAYLNGLVLFETISAMDVRRFGGREQAAEDLGIDEQTAVGLQQVALETVAEGDESRPEKHAGPCASDN